MDRKKATKPAGRRLRGWAVLLVTTLAVGGARADGTADEAAAQTALLPLKQGLKGALEKALVDGPAAAVDVCRLEAPRITAASGAPGVRVGRTSHRLRNPANAPAAWLQPLLDEYVKAWPGLTTGRVVDLGAEGVGYVEPIPMQPLCVTCHGSQVEPELLAHIRERYPDDRAVGFEVGDLRGLLWVVTKK